MSEEQSIRRRMLSLTLEARGNVQKARENFMNQLRCLVYRLDKGLSLDAVPDETEEKSRGMEYNDKKLPKKIEKLLAEGKISQEDGEYFSRALRMAANARTEEGRSTRGLGMLIDKERIWALYLVHIRGIGPTLGSSLINMLGECENSPTVASLWKYAGLHLVCPVCKQEKIQVRIGDKKIFLLFADGEVIGGVNADSGAIEDVKYDGIIGEKPVNFPVTADINGKCPKCGRRGIGEKRSRDTRLDFNSELRDLCFKIGDCLIKTTSPIYKKIYDDTKAKEVEHTYPLGFLKEMYPSRKRANGKEGRSAYNEDDTKLTQKHAHSRALRKMVKIFLQHYWVVGRTLAGLPVRGPYVQEKLGHTTIITWKDILRANGQEPPKELLTAD